jgi:outer membrane protein TolC
VALVVAYFLLPFDGLADVSGALTLPMALAAFAVLVGLQVRAILRSPHPGLRAVESLAITLPLFLIILSATYRVASLSDPAAFSEQLSKIDALYFTVTVFATVGFGDITATSDAMRVAVTVQMLADLVLIGAGLKIVTGAVREARTRAGQPGPPDLVAG